MNNVFKNLYQYRELLKTSVKKDIRGKYKNSFLGVVWSFLNPLLQIAVYAIIFPIILKNKEPNYVIFLCTGLIPWTFFSTALSRSSSIIVDNGNIIKKVYFPREILPISLVTSEAVNFIISTVIIIGFVVFGGLGLTKYILFYPIILIAQYITVLAFSFILSSITVYLRDIQHFVGIALQLLLYATPIVYNSKSIPGDFEWILKYNPMTYIVNAYRDIFYNQVAPDIKSVIVLSIIMALLTVVGYLIFSRLQKGFAEEL